ncbi:zinc finger protein ZFP2-like [Episyrphus balteatus]|uniref:zinc finger protein ZFP2-like n=1 Tax=Episyrphus balteatus TaxID=286459 RepID=UPI00248586DC|nr:zinc finger protein ZFP2-like [Episyrphus balteatus]
MSVAERTCRTCGKASETIEDPKLFPLFEEKPSDYENELKIIQEEFEIWNLDIAENDGLPQQICLNCFDSFCQIHNFRAMCMESQMNFSELCTGLDIFIIDEKTEENYDNEFAENIQIQEHYTFPGDKYKIKPSTSPLPLPPTDTNDDTFKELLDFDIDDSKPELLNEENEKDKSNDQIPECKVFICEYCMEIVSFDDPDLLNDHYNKLHSTDMPYPCPKCDKFFDTKAKRNSHARVHYDELMECEKCGKKIKGDKKLMWQHYENSHVEKDRQCPICNKKFKMVPLKRLNYHLLWHNDSRLHKCKYCEKKFIQSTHLAVHEKTHTGESPFKCLHCSMTFKNAHLLNCHSQVHGTRKFQCNQCPRKFFNRHGMNMHMRTHGDEINKHPRCEICNKQYRSKMNFRLHNYKKHGAEPTEAMLKVLKTQQEKRPIIKPYKCPDCPQTFVLHTQLVKHSKTHTENRPYSCKICLKAFKRPAHLKLHMDSLHLKKKPHKCLICGWGFPQRANLTEHMAAKHGDTKDFKCDKCPKEFATIKSLKVHKKMHNEKNPFVCNICNKGFKMLTFLKTHMHGHLRRKEADVEAGDITDIFVEENMQDHKSDEAKTDLEDSN